ncbi:MAG TPA: DUF2237 family protein [Arcobacter sp.]|nr:DUF2237 family protein [Arcobacter sp.]HIP55784.1 DUF2237 family protein [Arcobacter sp.]
MELNVLGQPLEPCSLKPLTGYFRDGSCHTKGDDECIHLVCIYASEKFLAYIKSVGNDLSTPMPQYNFAGVKPGQSWCLSAPWFFKSIQDNMAPDIFLHSTHERILEVIPLEILKQYALDA